MILDAFAGPGGWDVGLRLLGLDAIGIEIDALACQTRAAAGFLTIREDVAAMDPARFEGKLEGLIASPPCQDWSVAGSMTKRTGHTGWLVDEPMRFVDAVRPTWVAQEQVTGALPVWEEQARHYRSLGYHTWTGILSSERYGVPQTRSRAILMAHLEHPVQPPQPTHQAFVHGRPAEEIVDLFGSLRPWISMAEALGWGMNKRPSVTIMSQNGVVGGPRPLDGGSWARQTLKDAQEAGDWVVGFPRVDDGRGPPTEDGMRERDFRSIEDPAFTLTSKARSWVVDTRCDPRDGTTQTRGGDEPAPTITTRSGRQWQLHQIDDPHLVMASSNLRPTSRRVDQPAQGLAFGHNSAGWRWQDGTEEVKPGRSEPWPARRPATTVTGDYRVTAPHHHYHGEQGKDPIGQEEIEAGEEPGTRPVKIEPWEAAVLQSFPIDYPFMGARTRKFSQIGDAVPPFLAAAIVGELTGKPWASVIERLLYPEEFGD